MPSDPVARPTRVRALAFFEVECVYLSNPTHSAVNIDFELCRSLVDSEVITFVTFLKQLDGFDNNLPLVRKHPTSAHYYRFLLVRGHNPDCMLSTHHTSSVGIEIVAAEVTSTYIPNGKD